jgi:YHS domain-containing protein
MGSSGKMRKHAAETGIRAVCLIVLSLCFSFACTKTGPVPPVNVTAEGVAIKGYDPVAYFTDKRPVRGLPEFEYVWHGATWRFSSAAHREMFRQYPDRYAPRYGGYCAYAVSQGKIADIDPDSWTVFEERLYLNLDPDVKKLWEKDMRGYIRKADEKWPKVRGVEDRGEK